MDFKRGTSRNQIFLFTRTIDELVEATSSVRVIDVFIENLDLEKLGFKVFELRTGQPPYRNELLLKIFLYAIKPCILIF